MIYLQYTYTGSCKICIVILCYLPVSPWSYCGYNHLMKGWISNSTKERGHELHIHGSQTITDNKDKVMSQWMDNSI